MFLFRSDQKALSASQSQKGLHEDRSGKWLLSIEHLPGLLGVIFHLVGVSVVVRLGLKMDLVTAKV